MSSSAEMKRVITHAADQLRAAIDVEAKQTYHRAQTVASMGLAEGVLRLLASYRERVTPRHPGAAAMSRHVEVRDAVIDRTAQITAEENHGAVCTVLRWAKRTPGVTGDAIGEVCEQLGLNLLDAMVYGRQKARQG